jgi:putative flippase GtrA
MSPVPPDRGAELRRLARYAIVGAGVAGVFAGLYTGLRAIPLPAWGASLAAFLVAVAVQYVAHTVFTFRSPLRAPGQVGRFAATVTVGGLIAMGTTGLAGPRLGLPDLASLAVAMVLIPLSNFAIFRLWVYREIDMRGTRGRGR